MRILIKIAWILLIMPAKTSRAQLSITGTDKALSRFLHSTDTEEKANIAFELGENFWASRKLPQAKQWYSTCLELAPTPTDSNNVVNALHLLANVYLNEAVYDSALFYCNKSFTAIGQINNKKFLPNLYQTKGRIYLPLGDEASAIRFITIADSLYEISPYDEMREQSPYSKIVLGKLFEHQGQMSRAKEYFDRALQLSEAHKNVNSTASSLQTLANWYCTMKQFKKARDIYFQLLRPPLLNAASYRMIYIYTGLGDVYLGINKPDSSLHYFQMGMQQSRDKGEQYQQDVFYGKLGDAYSKLHNIPLAKLYYDSTLMLGKKYKNWSSSINAYQHLADIAVEENNYKKAYEYQLLKQQLNDSVFSLKNIEMSNSLYILNNMKQKDMAINSLTALDTNNRKLIKQGRVITYMMFGIIGLLAFSFTIITNRLKLKRRLAQQLAVAQERERIIADLHDDVGATLSGIHIYSELAGQMVAKKPAEAKDLMDKISQQGKDLLGKMSDIIWSLKPAGEEKYSFTTRLKNYSQELLAVKGIKTNFNIDETLNGRIVNPLVRKNILLIAKEAMNNIAKYSSAATTLIALLPAGEFIELTITDDGTGFDTSVFTQGNGLNNIRQRSKHINGICSISSSHGNGTLVTCKFPIANISHTG